MRVTSLLLTAALLAPVAWAQTRAPAPDPRQNQKIERLVVEDAGSRIEEVRVGGQSQSVTVQPKADVPPYEMPPSDLARSRPADAREGAARQRVWNVLSF